MKFSEEWITDILNRQYISDYLYRDVEGFSGFNHVMIAVMIYLLLLLIPVEPTYSIFHGLLANPIIGVISFFIICGAALLPDMDNLPSDGGSVAVFDLGVIGSIISTIMVTISGVITSIFRGKKDVKPNTQHRFFWHTLFVPIVMFVLIFFLMPDDSTPISSVMTNISLTNFPTHAVLGLVGIAICVYIGSHLLFKKLNNFLPVNLRPTALSLALTILSLFVCVTMSTNHELKVYCMCIALGYFFHLFGDLFADGGIPALFPISGLFGKFFMRIKLVPVTITTGGTIESMLKIVFVVIDLILAVMVFFPGLVTNFNFI